MNTIILYFSKTEKTKTVTYALSKVLNAETLRITDLKETNKLMNRITSNFNAFMENKTEIEPKTVDLRDYDSVYIGTPTRAGKPAPAIITLIDNLDLRGKDVFLFATSESDKESSAISRMEEKVKIRGGRVVESFTVNVKDKNTTTIINDTEVIINNLDLKFIR